jgi:hypothetical protein
MRSTPVFFSAWIALPAIAFLATAFSALAGLGQAGAEIGPCQPDGYASMICGKGDGAARVIEGTISPSKRLALAWRSTADPPTQEPSDGNLEDLVIRIGDGAILAKQEGEYWATAQGGHVNRLIESAIWSPNSRLMIKTFDQRFNTSIVDLYAFDANDQVMGPLDLLKIMEPALQARLKQRVKNDEVYEFSASDGRHFTIDNRGLVHVLVLMWVPKNGPLSYFEMTLQVTHKGAALDAKILSIRPSRKEL